MKNIIQCSFGRDSLALVEYLKDEWDESLILWIDAGGALPEVEAMAEQMQSRVPHFYRLRTDSNAWINRNGIPSDIVPVWHTVEGAPLAGNTPPLIASSLACCFENVMKPMHDFSKAIGAERIYRGQRNAEKLKSPIRSGAKDGDIEIVFPLQDWTDEQVDAYLADKGIKLPEWYANGDKGFDCWWCTGYQAESKGLHKYLEKHHPEKWAIVAERMDAAKRIVIKELKNGF